MPDYFVQKFHFERGPLGAPKPLGGVGSKFASPKFTTKGVDAVAASLGMQRRPIAKRLAMPAFPVPGAPAFPEAPPEVGIAEGLQRLTNRGL
jgi:hypothetical protein